MRPGLAALGLLATACGGQGGHAHAHRGQGGAGPPIPGAREISLEARSFAFSPAEIHVTVGESVNLSLTAVDILHDLTVVGLPAHLVAEKTRSATGGMVAPARTGRYAFVCTVPRHREAGMVGVLVVDPPT